MSENEDRKRIALDKLLLDSENPRLAFHHQGETLSQPRLVTILFERFGLEELAESFLSNGFFVNEPLVCIPYGKKKGHYVVVEGNRRLAALLLLANGPARYGVRSKAFQQYHERYGSLDSARKRDLAEPHVSVAEDRTAVAAYVGFRHVTGIKPWPALEKAGYIAQLIEVHGLTPGDIAQKIGSKPVYVARHYQAFRLLVQARGSGVDVSKIQDQFGVLMRALQTDGVRDYIGLEAVSGHEKLPKSPLSKGKLDSFQEFTEWAFGTDDKAPLFTDSRLLTKFGRVLRSPRAVEYLQNYPNPTFDQAYMMSGGETEEAEQAMQVAEFALRDCVATARSLKRNKPFKQSLHRAADYMSQILAHYPGIAREFFAVENDSV